MAAHENVFKGARISGCETVAEILAALASLIPNNVNVHNAVFACIGTDRSTGDSMGPLVGTYLTGLGYKVIGTIDDPLHAMNLRKRLADVPVDKTVIAIDACLGTLSNIGKVHVIRGSITPGAGVNKDLGEVGSYGITATVNVGGFMEYFVLQNTRLSLIMRLARDITSALVNRFPVDAPITVIEQPAKPAKRPVGRPRKTAKSAVAV